MWTNYIRSKYNATYQPTLHDWLKMTMGEEGITHKEYVSFFYKGNRGNCTFQSLYY